MAEMLACNAPRQRGRLRPFSVGNPSVPYSRPSLRRVVASLRDAGSRSKSRQPRNFDGIDASRETVELHASESPTGAKPPSCDRGCAFRYVEGPAHKLLFQDGIV